MSRGDGCRNGEKSHIHTYIERLTKRDRGLPYRTLSSPCRNTGERFRPSCSFPRSLHLRHTSMTRSNPILYSCSSSQYPTGRPCRTLPFPATPSITHSLSLSLSCSLSLSLSLSFFDFPCDIPFSLTCSSHAGLTLSFFLASLGLAFSPRSPLARACRRRAWLV